MWYSKSKSFDQPRPRYATGLRLIRKDGAMTVHSLAKGSPAARLDIHAGDTLLAINGKPAAELKLYEVRSILEVVNSRVNLTFRRGEKEVRVVLVTPATHHPPMRTRMSRFQLTPREKRRTVPPMQNPATQCRHL